ncbi:MAG: Response regulator [Actinomycetota bacterium]|nr:Response regulator [Actinomycetota bacterium]
MDSGLRVLVVDDEVPLTGVIGSYLRAEGFEVSFAHNGPDAVALAREVDPVLIVLDVMLPGFDGIEACRQIRQFSDAYVVMLTAQEEEIDKVLGLSMGADDYIVKPFSPRELIARVQAMLRRPRASTAGPADAEPITIGGLTLDTVARIVTVDGVAVELTRTEFDLLALLAIRPRAVVTRRQLIEDVWGTTWFGDDHVVDVHIGHLRSKLGDDATNPRFVRTVRGVGYAMGTG